MLSGHVIPKKKTIVCSKNILLITIFLSIFVLKLVCSIFPLFRLVIKFTFNYMV